MKDILSENQKTLQREIKDPEKMQRDIMLLDQNTYWETFSVKSQRVNIKFHEWYGL